MRKELNLSKVKDQEESKEEFLEGIQEESKEEDKEVLNAVLSSGNGKIQDELHKGFDRVIWEDRRLFQSDDENDFWNAQQDWNIVSWKLHGSSGVHTLVTEKGLVIHMLVEKKYPLRKEVLMQMLKLKLDALKLTVLWIRFDSGLSKRILES
ncbi:hypothetical protein Tco_1247121 [Tanacetum coccineum]